MIVYSPLRKGGLRSSSSLSVSLLDATAAALLLLLAPDLKSPILAKLPHSSLSAPEEAPHGLVDNAVRDLCDDERQG